MSKVTKLTQQQKEEIERLAALPDQEIDTGDIPEITDWSRAVVGRFYRPIKKQVTLRLDVDMIEWFKGRGGKYQTRINQVLREYMESH
ncbi:MAG: BrnA antitoxin family protein [Gammaproteobacteria bacterium]|nr:BrnA antitoxin family protein [Gammaproteobacteria bacterium]